MAAEKNFEDKIKKFLKDNGCWYVKYWSGKASTGRKYTKDGIPDLLACVNGFFLGIEVKAPNGKPSELQLYNRREIRKAGGICIVLYPNQFDDFKLLIDDLINRPECLDWNEQEGFDK